MRNIREGTTMNEGRRAFQGLHEIGRNRFLEQRGHRAMRFKVARAHRLAVARVADNDVAETFLEVVKVSGETEDRHNLGSNGDVEPSFARIAVGNAAQRADDLA